MQHRVLRRLHGSGWRADEGVLAAIRLGAVHPPLRASRESLEETRPEDKNNSVLQGFKDVSESFQRIFAESKTKSRIVPEDIQVRQRSISSHLNLQVSLRGATAVVTCQEKVVNKGQIQRDTQRPSKVCLKLRTILRATHVFRRGPGDKWLMQHRHASKPPGAASGQEGLVQTRTIPKRGQTH